MKKRFKLILFIMLIAVNVSLVGCNKSSKLATPEMVKINEAESILEWQSVENAIGYSVQIDESTRIILDGNSTTSYSLLSLTKAETYSLRVKALGDGKNYSDSDYSEAVTHIVSHPPTAGLAFELISSGTAYEVSIGTADSTQIVIPSKHSEKPVTKIAASSFSNSTSIASVIIPSSVVSIGNSSFLGCSGLTSILFEANSKLTSVGINAFYNCVGLSNVKLPASVTSIGINAFWGCTALTSIVFEEQSQLAIIGDGAFSDCVGLTGVDLKENTKLTSIGSSVFSGCTGLGSVVIPSSVTSAGAMAFWGCSSLTDIVFEEGSKLTGIADNMFWGCINLKNVTFKANSALKRIGYNSFSGCTGLGRIILPPLVQNIGASAFSGCKGLKSILIPIFVTNIASNAFWDCPLLSTIYYCGESDDWNVITIGPFNDSLNDATKYYYSETETQQNSWHYVDGIPTIMV